MHLYFLTLTLMAMGKLAQMSLQHIRMSVARKEYNKLTEEIAREDRTCTHLAAHVVNACQSVAT